LAHPAVDHTKETPPGANSIGQHAAKRGNRGLVAPQYAQAPRSVQQSSYPIQHGEWPGLKENFEKTTAYDPQWGAKSLSDIRVSFSDSELERYLELGRRAGELKIYPMAPPVQQKLDLSAAKKVDGETWNFDPEAVRLK
jgi:hypothetical protein